MSESYKLTMFQNYKTVALELHISYLKVGLQLFISQYTNE